MSISIRCPHCGKEIPITSQYCLGCGSTEVQNTYREYGEYLNSSSYTAPSTTPYKPYEQPKSNGIGELIENAQIGCGIVIVVFLVIVCISIIVSIFEHA